MKRSILLSLGLLAGIAGTARAQWFQTTYNLKGGWNAIYLHGDATYADPDTLFPNSGATAGVLEVWRWNPRPNQMQFTTTPLVPTSGVPEWNVWRRGVPAQSNLSVLNGQTAYLVRCSGTAVTSHSINIVQKAMPPVTTWVRSGANLLGFPSKLNGASYPSFATYFQTFPAATAANSKIFQYIGGDLGPTNPSQLFSTTADQVDRNKAYWFEAEVVGNFFAPLDLSLSSLSGIDFGRTGSVITARVRNPRSTNITLTLAPVASIAAPAGQDAVVGQVPLTRRTFNTSSGAWDEAPITAAYTEVIGAGSTVELSFGVNRAAMSGASNALYASLLRITDSANLYDISLPATARVASYAGLWIGDAEVKSVSSEVQTTATATAEVTDGRITKINLTGGGFGYGTVPVPVIAPPEGVQATATATVEGGKVTGLTLAEPGSGYAIAPVVTIGAPGAGQTATAVGVVKNGSLTGFNIVDGGSGYAVSPTVVIAPPATATVPAEATAVVDNGQVSGVLISNPGAGYFSAPAVTIAAPAGGGTAATALAVVKNGALTGITILTGGSGYTAAPVITVGAPPPRTPGSVAAIVQNGKVTGFNIVDSGSGYLVAPSITLPTPVPAGTTTARTLPLRVLLHVDDSGNARMLSQVFLGKLLNGNTGICTKESGLSPAEKAKASRLIVTHLPLDRVLSSGSGEVGLGQTLVRSVNIPFDDDVNPFVHRYHPDHNNKDARGNPLPEGVESYGVTRTFTFTFTPVPPSGVSSTGWGSSVIGGNYTEVLRGLHRNPITVTGTFVLRRANEDGSITIN